MTTSRKLLVLAAVAVAASGTWWWSARRSHEPTPAVPTSASVVQPVVSTPVSLAPACTFEKGQRFGYSVAVDSQTHQDVPSTEVPADFVMVLKGTLDTQVIEVRDQSAVMVAKWALESKGPAGIDPKAMQPPFLIEVDHQCQLLAFAREKGTARASARNQQSLFWETQFSRRPSDDFTLADTTGIARATLERVTDREIRRTLKGYQSRWDQEPPAHTSLAGVMTVVLGSSGWLESVSSRTTYSSAQGRGTASLELTSRPAGAQASFSAFDADQSHYLWENLLPLERQRDLISRPFTSFDRKRQEKVSALTVDQALNEFADRVKARVGVQSTWPELSAYLEVHPEAVKPALQKYYARELPKDAAGDFFLAIGKARTPEAREALLEIKRNDGAVMMDQVRAMFGLVLREDVGVDFAQELARDVRRHIANNTRASSFLAGETMLALSTMSGSRDDAKVSAVANQALVSVIQSEAPDSHAMRVALHAVGNTGNPGLLPTVEQHLASPDVETRKAAAHAFSRMPAADTDALEVEWLKRETSPFVRKHAYMVFQQQHFNPGQGATRPLVEQALKDLKTEKSAFTRKSIVLLIAQSSIKTEPQVRKALIEQARFERAKKTTLLNLFARVLTRDEVLEVLQ